MAAVDPTPSDDGDLEQSAGLAGQSLAIAAGTVFSRITGAGRIVVGAAVLGPTIIGDLFLAINILPLMLVGLFGGPAVTSVLVPPLVRRLEEDPASSDRLVSASLGLIGAVLSAISLVLVLARGWIAKLFVGGAAPEDRDRAIEIASDLLAFMVPQLVIYGLIAVLVAAQHARQQFLIPSFAPTVENVALIAALFAIQPMLDEADVSDNIVVLLAVASGVALLAHFAMQWWGAWRTGARFGIAIPTRDRLGGLQEMAGATRQSLVWTAANGALQFATIIVAGYAALGAIQAMQIALLVAVLPAALVGYPIAAAVLPRLARDTPRVADVRRAFTDGSLVALWAVVPFTVAMLAFARPIAEALAFGRFEDDTAIELTVMALLGLSSLAITSSLFEIARQATMAWGELAAIGRSIWTSMIVAIVGYGAALLLFEGTNMLLVVGLAMSAATAVALVVLARPMFVDLQSNGAHVRAQIVQVVVASAGALVAGLGAQWLIGQVTTQPQIAIVVIAICFLVTLAAVSRGGRSARALIADLEKVGS